MKHFNKIMVGALILYLAIFLTPIVTLAIMVPRDNSLLKKASAAITTTEQVGFAEGVKTLTDCIDAENQKVDLLAYRDGQCVWPIQWYHNERP